MKKVILLVAIFTMSFMSTIEAQQNRADRNDRRERTENFEKRGPSRNHDKKCKTSKRHKKAHLKGMRKMAAADGRISPREKRMLKRERRKVY